LSLSLCEDLNTGNVVAPPSELKQEDPHEWLLVHYGGSTPASAPPQAVSEALPESRTSLAPISEPEVRQLDPPCKVESANTSIVNELVAETLDGEDNNAATMDPDVEEELLSLVDDKKPPALRQQPPTVPSLLLPPVHSETLVFQLKSATTPVSAHSTSERGSMPPPPTSTSVNISDEPHKKGKRAGSVSVVSGPKKKDGPAKVRWGWFFLQLLKNLHTV
jgi:hypothetical protein